MPAGMNRLTHRQKVDLLITELRKQGVSPYTVAPPFFRQLWALGFHVPPPFFLGFFTLTLLTGIPFGVLWGAFMWLLQWQALNLPIWRPRHWSIGFAVLTAAGAGLLFGLSMAAFYRWKAARLRLPPWESYPAAVPESFSSRKNPSRITEKGIRMSTGLSSRKTSQFWIRFCVPVLVSLCLTPVLFCMGTGPGMMALGSHTSRHEPLAILFPILFPYTTLMFTNGFVHSNPTFIVAMFLVPLLQFPLYGILLGFANAKGKLAIIVVAFLLFAVHALAIVSNMQYLMRSLLTLA
jgi:uncharacterized protein DUF6404